MLNTPVAVAQSKAPDKRASVPNANSLADRQVSYLPPYFSSGLRVPLGSSFVKFIGVLVEFMAVYGSLHALLFISDSCKTGTIMNRIPANPNTIPSLTKDVTADLTCKNTIRYA